MTNHNFPKVDLEEFLAKNTERYEIVSDFQYKINHISQESYQEIIDFIESHSDIFFRDYESASFFFNNLQHFSLYNYKQLELILDIAVQFDDKMKKVGITDYDYFEISINFLNSQNYLFYKNLITISTIAKYSNYPGTIINFYPELQEYDSEYAKKAIKRVFSNLSNNQVKFDHYKKFFDLVTSNPELHKQNRIKNYHPSNLHKAIREDDISMFQTILSLNNLDVNTTIEKSFYERTSTTDKNLTLIQTAALYGSVNIFKFLWMQNGIFLNENLQYYSYSGRNHEIIHICEQKCSFKGVLRFAIHTHQNELVEYYLENFSEELNDDSIEYKDVLKKFDEKDDDENLLKKLNYESLKDIVLSMNWHFIFQCLRKIVFIIENFEVNSINQSNKVPTLLERSIHDFNFFKFLYGHKNPKFKFANNQFYPYFMVSINHDPMVLRFLLENENDNCETLKQLFNLLISNFPQKAAVILDFLIENSNESFKSYFKKKLSIQIFVFILNNWNEKLVLNILKFFDGEFNDDNFLLYFVQNTIALFSLKMLNSLILKISEFLPKEKIKVLIEEYKKYDLELDDPFE